MSKRRSIIITTIIAVSAAAVGIVVSFAGSFSEPEKPDEYGAVYETAENAAKAFVEEESVWNSTALIKTRVGDDLLLSERRQHVFQAGFVAETEKGYKQGFFQLPFLYGTQMGVS